MKITRLSIVILLAALTGLASGQDGPTQRGAFSPAVPYSVPGGLSTRAVVFVVSTTADEQDDNGCDPTIGAGLSLREAVEYCAEPEDDIIVIVPPGVYELDDDLDVGGISGSLAIVGADPFTTILKQTYVDEPVLRNDGHHFGFGMSDGTLTIANLTLQSGDNMQFASPTSGGAIELYGDGDADLYNMIFKGNRAASGGGVYASGINLHLTIANSVFQNNEAIEYGGAVFADNIDSLAVLGSVFSGNSAQFGGAVFSRDVTTVLLQDTQVVGNSAPSAYSDDGNDLNDSPGLGGGVVISDASTAALENTHIAANSAGSEDLAGLGGGLYYEGTNDIVAVNTQIVDNVAVGYGRQDCVTEGAEITSIGGNTFGTLDDCSASLDSTDRINNYNSNSSFEWGSGASADDWTVKAAGAARKCGKPLKKSFTPYGLCAMKMTGGTVVQKVDVEALKLLVGDVITVITRVDSVAKTNLDVKVIIKFGDGTPKAKMQVNVAGAGLNPDGYNSYAASAELMSEEAEKLIIKIVDKSAGGKAYVDLVFVYLSGVARDGGVLPPPAAPDGFRGGN